MKHLNLISPPHLYVVSRIFIMLSAFRIAYYAKQSDIQMAAMLCCTFGCRAENQDTLKNRQLSKSVNVSVSIRIIDSYSLYIQHCTLN
jgi:hypothetical protein